MAVLYHFNAKKSTAARITVIGVMDDIFIALLGGVTLKVFLLIDD